MDSPPRWPIFVSAAIFALMHAGNGPDPIPLFFLALGLGYLYRQTHRITPSMTVHFLLNAASMTLLWMELTFGGK
jgi:membrane protease YdiL (CAAX protease family)